MSFLLKLTCLLEVSALAAEWYVQEELDLRRLRRTTSFDCDCGSKSRERSERDSNLIS